MNSSIAGNGSRSEETWEFYGFHWQLAMPTDGESELT